MVPSRDSDKTDPMMKIGPADSSAPETPPPAWTFSSRVELDVAGASHPGLVRENNEDHFLVQRLGRFMETVTTNLPEEAMPPRFQEVFHALIVADGVGGGAAGEVASRIAIRTLVQLAMTSPNWTFRLDDHKFLRALLERLRERMTQIHEELIRQSQSDPELRGYGTTMTLGLSVGNVLLLAHIGDSRVYLLRQGALQQLTRDHTLAQDLEDKGIAGGQGVPVEQLRHVLTQALTDQERPVEPDVQAVELEDGDRVLLCTDGLSDLVDADTLIRHLGSDKPSEEICRELIAAALEGGGTDNVTAVVAGYRFTPDA